MAEPLPPIGFWSYTSSDDQHSDGRLSQLRVLLARELQLLIGQRPKVHIFQDVAAIPHGSDWADQIHHALGQSSFLIPIVTPGFLQSEWCCKEVMRFRAREEALGRNDLIFPFRYISIEDVDPNDPDECHDPAAFHLLASRQRFDFTPLRFHDPRGQEVATQLAALAQSVRSALRAGGQRRTASTAPASSPEQAGPSAGTTATTATDPAKGGILASIGRVLREINGPGMARDTADGPTISPPPASASRSAASRRPVPSLATPRQPSWLTPLSRWRDRIPGLPGAACPEMITLPAGTFVMGAPKSEAESDDHERPQRQVTVHRFALGRCAVTFAQWDAAREAGAALHVPDDEGWGRGDRPVINVSWNDAQAYCAWLNERLGLTKEAGYRLPSEAEWEYACRAGTTTPFSFGATISTDQVNYDGNYTYGAGRKGEYRERTVPVGSLPANPWGLHEMHGNVWEWCEDYFGPYPDHAADAAPLRHDNATWRVLRGGCWLDLPGYARSANRNRFLEFVIRSSFAGFRLARTPGA